MIQGHGGDIFSLSDRLGCRPEDIIDMSSNVNPLGPMPWLVTHLRESLGCIHRLPEVDARTIRSRFAGSMDLPSTWVAAGNGTTELIYLLPRALDWQRVLILGPTYADYADACRQAGVRAEFRMARMEDGFVPDLTCPDRRAYGYDAVFICNPNNPTGILIPGSDLVRMCRNHPDTLFVIDESYLPFAEPGDSMSRHMLDNVLVLHSMSKIHTLPGLRIGFITGHPDRISRIQNLVNPWAMNGLAQEAVDQVLRNVNRTEAFIQESRDYLDRERAAMCRRLEACDALTVVRGRTSFLLLALASPITADHICDAMAEERFLLRNCTNFEGLGHRYLRISLKTEANNRTCTDVLVRILDLL